MPVDALAVNEAGDAVVFWSRQKLFDFVPKVVASFHEASGAPLEPYVPQVQRRRKLLLP